MAIEEDLSLLSKALHEAELDKSTRDAFESMLERLEDGRQVQLSAKQREWINDKLGNPTYLNLVSSGKVSKGREVPTPAVLLNRPLKPPGRR